MTSVACVRQPRNAAPLLHIRALGVIASCLAACSSGAGTGSAGASGSGGGGTAGAFGGAGSGVSGSAAAGTAGVSNGGGAGTSGATGGAAGVAGGDAGGGGTGADTGGGAGTAAGGSGTGGSSAGDGGRGGTGGSAGGNAGNGGTGGSAGKGGAGGSGPLGPPGPFSCTQVIGYSQTEQWFGAFQAEVTDAKWELRWAGGHGVDVWKNANDSGWNAALVSPCATGSNDAERVLFSISGPHGSNVSAWEADIEAFMVTVRGKLPSAHVFILMPVVGGPNMNCSRADEQNPFIVEAIENVAAADPEVYVGYDPHVDSCSDFQDSLGHLTSSASTQIGAEIGQFYAANLPDP